MDELDTDFAVAEDINYFQAPLGYTIKGAMTVTGLSRTAIYDFLGQGRLEGLKAGRRTIITGRSIRALMHSFPRASIGLQKTKAIVGEVRFRIAAPVPTAEDRSVHGVDDKPIGAKKTLRLRDK